MSSPTKQMLLAPRDSGTRTDGSRAWAASSTRTLLNPKSCRNFLPALIHVVHTTYSYKFKIKFLMVKISNGFSTHLAIAIVMS